KGSIPSQANGITLGQFAAQHSLSSEVLKHLADDLVDNAGRSIVVAGDVLPVETQVAVNYLNEILGNNALYETGRSVTYTPRSSSSDIESLVDGMKSGRVGVVVHVGTNPVFQLPRGLSALLKGATRHRGIVPTFSLQIMLSNRGGTTRFGPVSTRSSSP
ncbi:MAG: molybdopterin oxidoreductase, iron-sulfur binding subunit, partial [Bacteroidetes bacterium]|nr:molybdopterin oxidoreductase, iron-sulfur binding subunit [Bacteroidota bacterium]